MSIKTKIFLHRNPYDLDFSKKYFLDAVKENLKIHLNGCPKYAEMMKNRGVRVDDLRFEEDLCKIPMIPTLYLKRNRLFSMPEDKLAVKATSSGTKGSFSIVGFDKGTLACGIGMMLRFFSYHRVISLIPTNYIMLGYEPNKNTHMGAVKTAYGTTKFAPALHRQYALKYNGKGYDINIDGIKTALLRYSKSCFPVRFVGFPAYMYFLAKTLEENGISLKLNKHSKILLGGGWKEFSNEEIDREDFYSLIEKTLGIRRENCLEFFSAVEHPLPYVMCKNGHFHVPIYSRVIIRDVRTLEPVANGEEGLVNFITPLVDSMPLTSVLTDDLAVMHTAHECGCGICTPYFELKGRAGVSQIKTCAAQASELFNGGVK